MKIKNVRRVQLILLALGLVLLALGNGHLTLAMMLFIVSLEHQSRQACDQPKQKREPRI